MVEEEVNDAELNEILGSTGELDVKEMTKVLHNKMISSALDELRKKPRNRANEELDIRLKNKNQSQKEVTESEQRGK